MKNQQDRKQTMCMKHCGKSTLAEALSHSWLWKACDLDDEILKLYKAPEDVCNTGPSKKLFFKGKVETFQGFKFMDQLATHIPPRRAKSNHEY